MKSINSGRNVKSRTRTRSSFWTRLVRKISGESTLLDDEFDGSDSYNEEFELEALPCPEPYYSVVSNSPKDLSNRICERKADELLELFQQLEDKTLLNNMCDRVEKASNRSFSQDLLSFINKKGISNAQCYNSAMMDKNQFSRIINSNPDYCPSKSTIICLAFGLRLDLSETEDLLRRAGYSLTNRYILDMLVIFFIENDIYDLQILDRCLGIFGVSGILPENRKRKEQVAYIDYSLIKSVMEKKTSR